MSVARYVNLSFVALGLLTYVVMSEFFAAMLDMFVTGGNVGLIGINFRVSNLIAMVVAIGVVIYLRRSERISTYALEVGNELSKVTWPTWNETKLATIVVIVVTLIIAAILGLLDLAWGALSSLLYS